MTLYRVSIEHTTYVLAMSEPEACDIAIREALRDEEVSAIARAVTPTDDIGKSGWQPDALPWGGSADDQTLASVWPKAEEKTP